MLLPEPLWAVWLQFLIVALGFAVMLGSRRNARVLASTIGFATMGHLLMRVFPDLALPLLAVAVPYILLRLMRHTLERILGKEATGTVLGTWTVRLVDAVVLLPFRGFARVLRWVFLKVR